MCLFNELLEPRFLLSFASLNVRGTLSVVGTSKNDTITVQFSGSKVQAIVNGQTESFNKSAVKRIWAEAFGGNDKVTNKTNLPSTLMGDSGNNTLVGGSADDWLFSIDGDATLAGGAGDNSFYFLFEDMVTIDYSSLPASTFTIQDEGIVRTSGAKTETDGFLNGEPSQTSILLTPGDDTVLTEAQFYRPSIYGGAGNDSFFATFETLGYVDGGPGDDLFYYSYDGGINTIIGASGNDTVSEDSGYGDGSNLDLGSGYNTWNVVADTPLEELPVYSRSIPPTVAKYTLRVNTAVNITGNNLDNDIEIVSSGGATVHGGAGNDRIVVQNSDMKELVFGRVSLLGDSGNDTLIGTGGPVAFIGGSGHDTAGFSARTDNLNITLDNHANDGAPGENDNVMADIETVLGGSGNDKIIGNPFANKLVGNAGNDTIFGGDGNDTLIGGPGTDHLDGQGGTDVIQQ